MHTNKHEDSYSLAHEFFVHGRHEKTRKGERYSFSCLSCLSWTLSSLFVLIRVHSWFYPGRMRWPRIWTIDRNEYRCSQLPVTLNAQDPQRRFSRKSTQIDQERSIMASRFRPICVDSRLPWRQNNPQWRNRIEVIGFSALLGRQGSVEGLRGRGVIRGWGQDR